MPVTQDDIDRMYEDGGVSPLEHWILTKALESKTHGTPAGISVLDLETNDVIEF